MASKKIAAVGAGVGVLRRLFARDHRILAAYLFGSRADGHARKDSDVDVALLLSSRARASAFDIKLHYSSELESLLGRRADVVILNGADPFLRFQVYSKGKPLFVRDKRKALAFQVYSMNEYWEYAPIQKTIEGTVVRRMLHGH